MPCCHLRGSSFALILAALILTTRKSVEGRLRLQQLKGQGELMQRLSALCRRLQTAKEARPKKIQTLQQIISVPHNKLLSFPPIPYLLEPDLLITGIRPDNAYIFKSALNPLRLTFITDDGRERTVIYKCGDDLRQDQLVLHIIQLMDKLLKRENLRMNLTCYGVLATGPHEGLVEYVESTTLSAVLQAHNGNIQAYLRERHRDDSSPGTFHISPDVFDTYLRSCAGYCVVTYLLGVGDRHLDNLLLTPDGHLFHIDFAYILGRDPKPFAPPMKLCREMIDAMGGQDSEHFERFQQLAVTAFETLRASANLILNLFALMVGSQIRDIALDPQHAVQKVYDRFRLDVGEEEARRAFVGLIRESVSAWSPQVMETLHKWVQYWRK